MNHGGRNGQQDAASNCTCTCSIACWKLSCDSTANLARADPFAYTFSLPTQGNHDHDVSHQALMNDEQQSYMDKFWDQPDQTTTNNTDEVMAFNFVGSGLNDKGGDNNMNAFGLHMQHGMDFSASMGLHGNHMHVPAPSAPRSASHMAPAYLSQIDASKGFDDFVYQNDQSATSNSQQRITHDDQAASALMSMSSNSQDHMQTAPGGASWGALNINNSANYPGDQLHMAGDPSSASSTTPLTPTITDNFQRLGRTPSHAQYPPQNMMQQATLPGSYAHTRQSSLPMSNSGTQMFHNPAEQWQMTHAAIGQDQNQSQRPPLYQYGSDQNFSQQGYQAVNYSAPEEKYNNLLSVPLASIARDPPAPTGAAQQHRYSVPDNNLQQLSSAALARHHAASQPANSTFQRSANHLQSTHPMADPDQLQQSRKRRRSQLDDEGAMSYGQAQNNSQNNFKQARHAPTALKQEVPNEQRNAEFVTPPGSSNKFASARPGTASATASASPSTPVASTFRASSSSKKRRSDPKQPRNNLSDTQKRNNHIASEQKRRDAMKTNYEELNTYVPLLSQGNQGISRSEILQHSGDWLALLTLGNNSIMAAYGVTFDDIADDVAGDQHGLND
jgi:hypothetical protein